MDAKKDLPKVGKFGLSVLTDPFSAVEMIPEVLSKMKLKTYKVRVPVRDLQPCSEDWGGFITVKHTFKKTEVINSQPLPNGNSTGHGFRTKTFVNEAIVDLRPRLPEEMTTKPPNKAVVSLNGHYKDVAEMLRSADPCCGKNPGEYITRVKSTSEMKYSRNVALPVSVMLRTTERDYSLGFNIRTDTFMVKYYNTNVVESSCPLEEDENYDREIETQFNLTFNLLPGRYPDRFVNTAGDLLAGSKTTGSTEAGEIVWRWELARCKN